MGILKNMGIAAIMGFVIATASAGDFGISNLELNHPDGIYQKGEEIVVTGTLLKAEQPAPEYKLRVVTRWESVKAVATQEFPCDGKPFAVSYRNETPGWVYFTFHVIGPDGEVVKNPSPRNPQYRKDQLVAEIGAMIAPEEIRPADEPPADFDEFWKAKRAKLDTVPMNPRLERIDSETEGIALYTIKLDAGVSRPVTGYLAVPLGAKEKSLPIYLTFLDGVDGDAYRERAIKMAVRGTVAMITTWHGFEVNQKPEYYKENCAKLERWKSAADGREAFCYNETLTRAMRAADYIKTRPEWNGKDFLVGGGSLAGGQAAAVAALDRQVTIAFIHTTSLCGYNGDLAGRKRSLPFHWQQDSAITPEMRKGAAYSDVVHLAKYITCECYFCTGFADEICTPSNVFTAYNNVPKGVKKMMYTNPRTGHYGTTRDLNEERRIEEFFKK